MRAADGSGQLHESVDAGKHWTNIGLRPPYAVERYGPLLVTVEFDPSDLDHAIFVSAHESFVTRDGGQRWARLGTQPLALEFSPVDGKVVWAWGQHRSVALGGREASTSTPFPCPTRTA